MLKPDDIHLIDWGSNRSGISVPPTRKTGYRRAELICAAYRVRTNSEPISRPRATPEKITTTKPSTIQAGDAMLTCLLPMANIALTVIDTTTTAIALAPALLPRITTLGS